MGIHLLGASVHNAPLEILERLALSPELAEMLRERLGPDTLILSTCNRTEIYVGDGGTESPAAVLAQIKDAIGVERANLLDHLYLKSGVEGIRHLYRVACGLDSAVLGEAQILGQVREAWDHLKAHAQPSPVFERIISGALKVAASSRELTEIGAGAVSVASASVQLTKRIFSSFGSHSALVLGAGATARLAAEHLTKLGLQKVYICNRNPERGRALAQAVRGEFVPLNQLEAALSKVDILATAVSVEHPIVTRVLVENALRRGRSQSFVVLDMGLPRNVDSTVNQLPNVFLYDVGALNRVVDINLTKRRSEIPRVESLIEDELSRLRAWKSSMAVGPMIAQMRGQADSMRRAEIEKVSEGLSAEELERLDRVTRAVMNKLLHGPTMAMKEYARQTEEGIDGLTKMSKLYFPDEE
jgi:glutamyl-tRNA reductase